MAIKKRYALLVSDKVPTCDEGASCDAKENPGHHVEIRVNAWVLRAVRAALKELGGREGHTVNTLIYGTKGTPVERELRAALDALREAR